MTVDHDRVTVLKARSPLSQFGFNTAYVNSQKKSFSFNILELSHKLNGEPLSGAVCFTP